MPLLIPAHIPMLRGGGPKGYLPNHSNHQKSEQSSLLFQSPSKKSSTPSASRTPAGVSTLWGLNHRETSPNSHWEASRENVPPSAEMRALHILFSPGCTISKLVFANIKSKLTFVNFACLETPAEKKIWGFFLAWRGGDRIFPGFSSFQIAPVHPNIVWLWIYAHENRAVLFHNSIGRLNLLSRVWCKLVWSCCCWNQMIFFLSYYAQTANRYLDRTTSVIFTHCTMYLI